MLNISPEARAQLDGPVQTYALRGACGGREFSGDHDVLQGTFRIMNQICEATEVSLGGVYVGQLNLIFSDRFARTRGGWMDQPITAEIGIKVEGDYRWVAAPGGEYYIKDATWTQDGLQITAYDSMCKFDEPITLSTSSGEAYDFLMLACRSCKVTLGMSRAEVRALPNGSETLGLYPTDSVQTWRDMLSWLAQALCSFATIDRQGRLVLRQFPTVDASKMAIDTSRRFMGASFSDFDTYYTKITVEDIEDNEVVGYSVGSGGLTMNLGANPFLQYGLDETVKTVRRRVIDGLAGFKFAPFSITKLLDPSIDLGDCLEFPGGIGRGCVGMVMAYTMDLTTISLQGFGDNPALATVTSDADKATAAASSTAKSKDIVYITSMNVSDITVGTTEQDIVSMRFYTTEDATVTMWAEIDSLITNSPKSVEFAYYVDGEKLLYMPKDSVGSDGWHIFTLNYYLLGVEPGELHQFTITAKTDSGTMTINTGDLHFLMSGQGLAAEDSFGGTIEVDDSVTISLGGDLRFNFRDVVEAIRVDTPIGPTLTDTANIQLGGDLVLDIRENVEIISKMDVYEMITEDGANLLTEEGGLLLTEGDIV